MIEKRPILPARVRRIEGGFAFIEHRFLRNGFLESLDLAQLALYVFLVLASDRNGLSYYAYDKICALLRLGLDEYILARDQLIEKDLIAFDGRLFQVLSLPEKTPDPPKPLVSKADINTHDPAAVRRLIETSLGDRHDRS
jgi:hypothetical protein